MKLTIPELAVVALVGPSGSGKSSFARKHFRATEVLSSDFCRGLVSDEENSQAATNDAFEVLYFIASKRLTTGKLVVIDATNVQVEARKPIIALARQFHCIPVAIVFDLPEKLCHERNRNRPDRDFGPHVIRQQSQQLRRSLRNLQREGFRRVHILDSPEEVDAAEIVREPLWNNLKHDHGPKIPEVLRLVMSMVQAGTALCVPGNHDIKLMRKLRGKDVQITHGLADSLLQLDAEPAEFRVAVADFIDDLVSHYVLDSGKLVVAHAGLKEQYQGRGSGRVREFALYGETTGETDEFGLPVRHNWAAEYRGAAMVVYGHTPIPEPDWLNRTVNIDTGCVFGGRLTALRYPEKEFVSVPAIRTYCEPSRPFLAEEQQAPKLTAQQAHDDVLDADDVLGKRIITTGLLGSVTIREAE